VADYRNAESKNQQKWLLTLKLLATLAICVVLVWQADWANVLSTLKNTHASLLVFVFVLMVMSVTLSTYKWKLMLSIHNIQYNFSTLHKYYFIAQFLNNFLPTSIGGDAYRVYKTWDNPKSNSYAVIAVFMERLTGMAALALLA
jgi:glycosyltransferase 2 family protein